ncbi:MAG: hypothetical protein O4805_09315 [Trichodesmium sp. St16_bin2-tuft]|nr:hypothetical protein [Trichodesmium sp. St16_bin2-tuft]
MGCWGGYGFSHIFRDKRAIAFGYYDNNRTYAGKLRNPVSRRYLCVKNNDLLSKPGFFA